MRVLGAGVLIVLWTAADSPASGDTSPRREWRFTETFGGALEAWETVAGTWEIREGALVGDGRGAAQQCGLLRLRRDLGSVSELEVEAELLEAGRGTNSGLQIQFGGQKFYHYLGISGIWPPYVTTNEHVLTSEGRVRIRLTHRGSTYEFRVDGRLILSKTSEPSEECPVGQVALWATYGATVRYDNLRLR